MKKEEFFCVLGEVDEQDILKAGKDILEKKRAKKMWLKWGTLAACICIVMASVIGILLKKQPLTVTLDSGEEITFSGNGSLVESIIDISIGGNRKLSESEARAIFGASYTDASVIFEKGTNEFIILEGTIDGFDIEVRRCDIQSCVVVEGKETASDVNGFSVTAGYFITDANSKGNRTAIVYASFVADNYTVYLETAGADNELELLCNALAEEVFKLTGNKGLNFEMIKY